MMIRRSGRRSEGHETGGFLLDGGGLNQLLIMGFNGGLGGMGFLWITVALFVFGYTDHSVPLPTPILWS